MHKPTVYLDTTIISAYWYDGADLPALARRFKTREWWNTERQFFELWASAFTQTELSAGLFPYQADCLRMVRLLRYLPSTSMVRAVFDRIVKVGLIPLTKMGDATQMAVATAHEIDYLLTWNYAHLANPIAQERLTTICTELGLRAPLLVSPEMIPQVRFGQTIRRR